MIRTSLIALIGFMPMQANAYNAQDFLESVCEISRLVTFAISEEAIDGADQDYVSYLVSSFFRELEYSDIQVMAREIVAMQDSNRAASLVYQGCMNEAGLK